MLFVLFGVWGLVAFSQNIDQTETGSCAKFRVFFCSRKFKPSSACLVCFENSILFCLKGCDSDFAPRPEDRQPEVRVVIAVCDLTIFPGYSRIQEKSSH